MRKQGLEALGSPESTGSVRLWSVPIHSHVARGAGYPQHHPTQVRRALDLAPQPRPAQRQGRAGPVTRAAAPNGWRGKNLPQRPLSPTGPGPPGCALIPMGFYVYIIVAAGGRRCSPAPACPGCTPSLVSFRCFHCSVLTDASGCALLEALGIRNTMPCMILSTLSWQPSRDLQQRSPRG
jgi:hypothetical protein